MKIWLSKSWTVSWMLDDPSSCWRVSRSLSTCWILCLLKNDVIKPGRFEYFVLISVIEFNQSFALTSLICSWRCFVTAESSIKVPLTSFSWTSWYFSAKLSSLSLSLSSNALWSYFCGPSRRPSKKKMNVSPPYLFPYENAKDPCILPLGPE